MSSLNMVLSGGFILVLVASGLASAIIWQSRKRNRKPRPYDWGKTD